MSKKKSPSRSRRFFFLAVLVILGGIIIFYGKKESIVRQVVQQELANRFPEYQIQVSAVRTLESKGVVLYGLQIDLPGRNGIGIPIMEADEILIQTPITFSAWLQGTIAPQKLTVTRPVFRLNSKTMAAIRRLNSEMNPPPDSPAIPVDIKNGSIAVTSASSVSGGPLTVVYSGIDINLTPPGSVPAAPPSPPDSASAPNKSGTLPQLSLTSDSAPPPSQQEPPPARQQNLWKIEGECRNPYMKEVKVTGSFSPDLSFISITGNADDLELTPRILTSFANLSSVDGFDSFMGHSTFSFGLTRNTAVSPQLQYQLDGELYHGSFVSPILPHPVSDIFAKYKITESEIKIERLTARSGPAVILAECESQLAKKKPLWRLKAQLEDFPLTDSFVTRLPLGSFQKKLTLLSDLTFSATADLYLNLYGEGSDIAPPEISLNCSNLTASHKSIPFKPEQLNGVLKLEKSGRLRFLFKSDREERNLQIAGDFPNVYSDMTGRAALTVNRIPLDTRFIESIPEKYRSIILPLHPTGLLSGKSTFSYDGTGTGRPNVHVEMQIEEGGINYDLFPYPVTGITGNVTYDNGSWQFNDFQGTNGVTSVTAHGTAVSNNSGGEFQMAIHADRFPLGDDFRNALLNPFQADLAEQLHLRGEADADVQITFLPAEDRLDMEINADLNEQETSIQPEHFPYLLSGLKGKVHYKDGEITVSGLRGKHGTATFSAEVAAALNPNDGITFQVAPLVIDQIQIDHELKNAVPASLLPIIESFSPEGYFNADGGIIWRRVSSDAPIEFAWDADIFLHNNKITCGKDITGICGTVLSRGYSNGTTASLHGQLELDNLNIGTIQATQISGPYYADNTQVLFGTAVPQRQTIPLYSRQLVQDLMRQTSSIPARRQLQPSAASSPVAVSLFHGKTAVNALITRSEQPKYRIEFNLQDGNLHELIRDINDKTPRLDGKISLFADIQGEGKTFETATGHGGITIKDAALYELPVMMQVFNSLSVNEPDRAAFNTSFVDFQIYGNRLKLDRVLLEGESLTLFGDGWLTLEGNEPVADITLNSRLSRVRNQVPILSDVLGTAGDQIAQIKVEGPLSSASVRQDSFPGIKKVFGSIFSGGEDNK